IGLSAAMLFCASIQAQVSNDHCSGAIPITGSAVLGSNVGATIGPEPLPSCLTMSRDVWYAFVPPCNGVYTVSTCAAATDFNTIVAVWDGAGGCGTLAPVSCSDVCSAGAFQGASITLALNFNHSYYVSVGGNFGATGNFSLSVTLGAAMSLSFFSSTTG